LQSVLEYYWTKVFENGNRISQFDDTGKLRRWFDDDSQQLKEVRFDPFPPGLVEKVKTMNGFKSISLDHKPLVVTLQPNDEAIAYWDNGLSISNPYACDQCGWQWMTVPAYEFPRCPQCETADEFVCQECNSRIPPESVIRKPEGQLECPNHTFPQGLLRYSHIKQIAVRRDFVEYVIEIKNKLRATITDTGEIRIESLDSGR
jgi:DNA-directed RNA polymerase subunit RPC12/RpoP